MPIPLYLLSIKKQAYPMHEGKAPRTHFFVFGLVSQIQRGKIDLSILAALL